MGFMGQKFQPTVSKHWRKRSPKDQASIPLGPPHCADNNTTYMCSMKKTQNTHRWTQLNLGYAQWNAPSVTKPNPKNCKNCSSKCAYDCAQLSYTIQHRTVLIISPWVVCGFGVVLCCAAFLAPVLAHGMTWWTRKILQSIQGFFSPRWFKVTLLHCLEINNNMLHYTLCSDWQPLFTCTDTVTS